MKKLLLSILAAASLVTVSCSKVDLSPLEKRVADLEKAVKTIQEACDGGDYITDVKEIKNSEGTVIGYEILFKDHGAVVIRHGKDGVDGINGEDGEDGDSQFKDVQVTDDAVTFILADGTSIVIPMVKAFCLNIEKKDYENIGPNEVIKVPYTLSGASAKAVVSALEAGGYKVKVEAGKIVITAPALPGNAQILVIADNGDGKTSAVILNLSANVINLVVDAAQIAFKGAGETITATMNVPAAITATAPDWVQVATEGTTLKLTATANPDSKAARLGMVILKTTINDAVSTAEILVAQAAAGCKIGFDSFSVGSLNGDIWKGDMQACGAQIDGGKLIIHGNPGGGNDRDYPLFWYGGQIRRNASDSDYNTLIATIDIKADGGEGGLMVYNQNGYEGNTYKFDTPNYRYFTSSGAGSTSGGFYGFNKGGLAAADFWNSLDGKTVTEWIRLEISNVDRGLTEHTINPDWGMAYIWSLEEDANGVLQQKDVLWAKELWWWNDGGNQPTTDWGYVGIWGRSNNWLCLKNFVISYTDR